MVAVAVAGVVAFLAGEHPSQIVTVGAEVYPEPGFTTVTAVDNSATVHGRRSGGLHAAGQVGEREFDDWLDGITASTVDQHQVVDAAASDCCGFETGCGVAAGEGHGRSREAEAALVHDDAGEHAERDLSRRAGQRSGSHPRRGDRDGRGDQVASARLGDGRWLRWRPSSGPLWLSPRRPFRDRRWQA